ncbi:hypothetical protein NE237_027091 [Protea cynaroides]|uniref:Uncharacterized protein n=1 Tax=Protea cynaroides TaxID=273540 RepID=A0A9Q0GR68_9MAGN|nr:hypothetical protein NE237_027091 [Protea cynaroides]
MSTGHLPFKYSISKHQSLYLPRMVPHLDLLLLACVHGTLISCILLITLFFNFICLLLAISVTLLSIVFIDAYGILCLVSSSFATLKYNLELGFVLLLCRSIHWAVDATLALIPPFKLAASELKAKAWYIIDHLI